MSEKDTMPTADGEEPKLSKSQQKKLAKQAEKQAKKAAAKAAGNGGGNGGGSAANKPVEGSAATTTAPAPKKVRRSNTSNALQLMNVSLESSDALKVMWASQFYGIELEKSMSSSGTVVTLVKENGETTQVMGGNAIVQCLKWMSSSSSSVATDDLVMDQWCEMESSQSIKELVKSVEAALQSGVNAHHLVGHSLTVADICIASTLSTLNGELSTVVQSYLQAHQPAMGSAKQALEEFMNSTVSSSSFKPDMNNPLLQSVVEAAFVDLLKGSPFDLEDSDIPPKLVAKCTNAKHGDYQCTAAMSLFGTKLRAAGYASPQAVAQTIVDIIIEDNHPVLDKPVISGPGFVVVTIRASYLEHFMNEIVMSQKLPLPLETTPYTCLVDFSSPNIAKEMHVGHLRSTIIGESVSRILERIGCNPVHRVNHVGDWGTQFGMLIQFLKEEYPNFADSMPNITDLTGFYKAAKIRFDQDEEFKKVAQLNVVKLQSGDEECRKIWTILCDVSRKEFDKVYNRLDITVHECGESFYNSRIPPVIEEFEKAGLVQVIEGGAKCVFLGEPHKIPLMLQKSDGGFGYDSTDMAALKYRLHTLKAKRIIVITDFGQAEHFAMCNQAARNIGWVNDGQELQHIGFGQVQGDDGKRFKTRSGDTVRLVDLLDEAVRRMEASLSERVEAGTANITKDEVHGVAEAIGYSAVKYFDLRRNPTTNYKFSYDQMLETNGNTAVYLLYAHARFESIMAKAKTAHNVNVDDLLSTAKISIAHPAERNLAFQLHQFADTMELTLKDLYPYHICDYLYAVAKAAAEFVTQCKVLGEPEMESRLLLCKITTLAMRECFELLGIRSVQRI